MDAYTPGASDHDHDRLNHDHLDHDDHTSHSEHSGHAEAGGHAEHGGHAEAGRHTEDGGHSHAGGHGHEHGKVDADLYGNRAGLRAVQISTAGMLIVSVIQLAIALFGGSAGLLADALHNFGDVFTTVALWIAFVFSNRAANERYTYGYYRAEDLAGIFIVLIIIASAVASLVESILKLSSGQVPTQLGLSMAAALVGFVGNEVLAQYKISVGKRINSVALVADGQHSRIDGVTSLAAFFGLVGVALGLPLADPIAGILISIVIVSVVYSTARSVLRRLLDSVDPHIVPAIVTRANAIEGVKAATDVRARWVGHTLHIAMNIEVDPQLTLLDAHTIAEAVRHDLFHTIEGVSDVIIHTDPHSHSEDYHETLAHHMQRSQHSVVSEAQQ